MNAVEVESISKRYRLGEAHQFGYKTLRDAISGLWGGRRRRPSRSDLWALRDVSFSVREGEALGIIGRNGAGKSTLLKILSRITEPTEGRARLRGRVASLLEVGTGFHPELTGRENVFLNGAILGMSRAEVRDNFDAIVAFAEIEKFLDTPVKRYSSGMYVRLAFAVAAHLTPEILIVDEVLAVGDSQFQKRCLGRMSEVAHSGRTVLFVSHNMGAITDLCPRSVWIDGGRVEGFGETRSIVSDYLSRRQGESLWDFRQSTSREGTGAARIERLELLHPVHEEHYETIPFGQPFRMRLHCKFNEAIKRVQVGVALLTDRDERLFLTSTSDAEIELSADRGEMVLDCRVGRQMFLPGTYRLEAWVVNVTEGSFADHLTGVGKIEIVVGDWDEGNASSLIGPYRGRIYVPCDWIVPVADQKVTAC